MSIAIYRAIILLAALLANQAAVLVAVVWTTTKLHPEFHMARWGVCYAITLVVFHVLATWTRALRPETVLRPLRATAELTGPLLGGLGSAAAVFVATAPAGLPAWGTLVTAVALSLAAVLAVQCAIACIVLPVLGLQRRRGYNVLLVGYNDRTAQYVQRSILDAIVPVDVLGYVDAVTKDRGACHAKQPPLWPCLGDTARLSKLLVEVQIDEVWIVLPIRSCYEEIQQAIHVCRTVGIPARVSPDLFDHRPNDLRGFDGRVARELYYADGPTQPWKLLVKRALDLVGAAALLVALTPVFALVALVIRLTSSGPVLFRQTRSGLHNAPFTLYKFRTMVEDADARKEGLQQLNEADGPVFKIEDDPRFTPIGRFLRRTSLDELPQLWNVLLGEMSLVGPRPPLPEEVSQYDPWQRRRLSVLPGLTCIWQVSGRSEIPFERWMQLDLQYITTWSLWQDFRILLRTLPAVLLMRGAR